MGKAGNEINDPIVDPVLMRGDPPHANEYGGLSSRLLTLLSGQTNHEWVRECWKNQVFLPWPPPVFA